MRILAREVMRAVTLTAMMIGILCGVYPITVFALAQGLFPDKANGSIVYYNGAAAGSRLLGQRFTGAAYFHSRPSAAGNGYDARASGGSNLGPTSKDLIDRIRARVQEYRQENGLPSTAPVPADAVTASGSGLDPHISLENALLQGPRVAKARGLDVSTMAREIRKHSEGRTLGILGEPRINVLRLNMLLDREYKTVE